MLHKMLNTIHSNEIDENTLILPNYEGNDYIRFDTIVRCEAEMDNCIICLNNGNKLVVSKSLKSIAKKLSAHMFVKVHPLHIVNLAFVNRYVIDTKDYLVMHDGTQIPISNSNKKVIKDLLNTV
jgi:two-component system, LytTR family, response regulator